MSAINATPFLPGPRLIDGGDLNRVANIDGGSVEDAITATPAGTQANSYQITAAKSRIATVANANDSVKMPPAALFLTVTIQNSGANNLTVFGSGTDTINGTAGATGVTVGNAKQAQFTCFAAGAWIGPVALA